MIFDNYPWTNFHELNLDWLIRKMMQISEAVGLTRSLYQAHGVADHVTALPAGVITQIPLTSNGAVVVGNAFAISNDGGITVKETGTYKITASAYLHAFKDSTSIGVYIYTGDNFNTASELTSARIHQNNDTVGFYGAFSVAPKLVKLNAGQSAYLQARVNGADSEAFDDAVSTYLMIERVD